METTLCIINDKTTVPVPVRYQMTMGSHSSLLTVAYPESTRDPDPLRQNGQKKKKIKF